MTRLVIAACLVVPSLCQAQSPIGLGYQAPPGDPDPGTKMVCALYSGSAHDKLAGIGPRLDGLITCAHQHDPTFPQNVPDPDRVRLGDWIGIKAADQGGRSCRVEATDGDRTLMIVNFLSGESAGRTGFSIRKRGWIFPDQADRTVTIQTARMDFTMAAHPSDDVLEGILGKAQALQLLRALDRSNRMTVQVSPHVSSWSLPIKGAARAAEFLDTCEHASEISVQR